MDQQQQQHPQFEPTKFFELEQSVQQLRPLVVQVLRTQLYHNSTAAVDLRRGIRKVREICKQLRAETVYLSKQRKATEQSSASAGGSVEQTPKKQKVEPTASTVIGNSPSGMNFVIVQPADDQKVPVA